LIQWIAGCRDILGHGIVTSDGDYWKQQRAMLSPAFHFSALERLQKVFDAAAGRLV
jgi:cytochrome P450